MFCFAASRFDLAFSIPIGNRDSLGNLMTVFNLCLNHSESI